MGLLDQIYNVVDSLSTLESMPAVIDTAKVDTSNILNEVPLGTQTGGPEDITDLPPSPTLGVQSRGEMYEAGVDVINTQFDSAGLVSKKVISELERTESSLKKIASYGYNVSGKQRDLNKTKQIAIESLNELEMNRHFAKSRLDRKLFGLGGRVSYHKSESMSAEELSALAIEMGVEPNLLAEVIRSLPLQRKPSMGGGPGYERLVKYPQK